MAQHDFNIANATFPSVRSDINSALTAINTTQSGTTTPASAVAGTIWLDTTSATTPTLKYYDGADNISLATLDHSANTVNWLDSTVSITGLSSTATGTVLTLTDSASTSTVNLIIDNQKEVRFNETTANGTNYVALKAPASVSADLTFTLPATDGTSGQVLTTNGSGVLSFATPSAGGTLTATASGSITQGDLVALSDDGKVFAVSGTNPASLYNVDLNTTTSSSQNVNSNIASNADGSLLLQIYPHTAGNDVAVVAGTVSAGVVTWGTPLVIATTLPSATAINVTFDPTSGNFVIYYFNAANSLEVRTISVSGTTCTANTAVTTANIDDDIRVLPVYYDSTAVAHVVLVHPTATAYPSAIVVTVSGTTVTLAATVNIVSTASTATIIWSDCRYDSTLNKGVFLFHNNTRGVSLALGTISSGVISFGTALSTGLTQATPTDNSMDYAVPLVTYDNDQSKVLMVYAASGSGTIYSYTVSGTTLTASTTYAFTSINSSLFGIYYLSAKKVLILMGSDAVADTGVVETFYLNTTSGTYIEDTLFTTNIGFVVGFQRFGSMFYLNSGQRFGFYQSSSTLGDYLSNLKIFDIPTTNFYIDGTTSTSYRLGISNATYSDGNTATINYFGGGSIYTHSSSIFTIGVTYYKQYDNTFTTTSTGVFSNAGFAVTTGKLIMSLPN